MSLYQSLIEDLRCNCPWISPGFLGMLRALALEPCFSCVAKMRVMYWAKERRGFWASLVVRCLYLRIVSRHQCYFSPSAKIGRRTVLPHPTGIVVGDGVRIGDDVTIYQGVTFGRASRLSDSYPQVGDESVVYAGAVVCGCVILSRGSRVPALARIIESRRAEDDQ